MTAKHARLAAAVADAILAQNFTQANVARMSGVSQSMISAALCGKYDLKEEKWRMICETMALDYDVIIADPEPERIPVPVAAPERIPVPVDAPEEAPSDPEDDIVEPVEDPAEVPDVNDDEKHVMDIVARYLARKLAEDIRAGTDLGLDELYHLLSMCKKAQEIAQT